MRNWDIQRAVFTVSDFLSWAKVGELELSPAFQRRSVWPKKAKSYLIDTIYRGLPVPILFLRERTELSKLRTIREVVDGQQRLRTIISYINPACLEDFSVEEDEFTVLKSHNKDLAGIKFRDLDDSIQERILRFRFSVDVLPSDTDDADVLKIFSRMNSTGTKLNGQELRNAEYFGEFKGIVYDAAYDQLDRWKAWGIFDNKQIARMAEVELTSELFIYLISGVQSKTQTAIGNVYGLYDDLFEESGTVVGRFEDVLEKLDELIGQDIRNTVYCRHPLFYSLFVAIDKFYFSGVKKKNKASAALVRERLKSASDRISRKAVPEAVVEATQRRLGHKSSRDDVIDFLTNSLAG